MKQMWRLCALGILAVLPTTALAGPIIRSGENISVDASQVLSGDFYGFGSTVIISGKAENDAFIGGGNITINAPVEGDLSMLGGMAQVHGEIGDDVRAIGGEVIIANPVKGDVVVLAGSLQILSTATIEGDVLFMGGELTIDGDVQGAIYGNSKDLRINGVVEGDISFAPAETFTLGNDAEIHGDITYKSAQDIIRAQGADVRGEVHRTQSPVPVDPNFSPIFMFEIGVLLFAAFALFLMARRRIESIVEEIVRMPGQAGLIGLLVLFVLPFIGGVLLVSIIGLLPGILVLLFYAFSLITSLIGASILLGYILQKIVFGKSTVTLPMVGLGVLLYGLVSLIPYVGGIMMFAGIVMFLGGLCLSLYRSLRK